jgi:hypothetical protein
MSVFGVIMSTRYKKIKSTKALDNKIAELINNLDADYERALTMEEQGDWWLGYYHEKGKKDDSEAVEPEQTRPRVDWSAADWTKSDAELADIHGVSRQAARAARLRRQVRPSDATKEE